jgi:hypothetical protein
MAFVSGQVHLLDDDGVNRNEWLHVLLARTKQRFNVLIAV